MNASYSPLLTMGHVPPIFEKLGQYVAYRKGDIICTPEGYLPGIFLLSEGRVEYYFYSSDGRKKTILILEPGCIIGDCPSFDSEPAGVYVKAIDKVVTLFVEKCQFWNGMRKYPAFSDHVIMSMCKKTRSMMAQMEEFSFRGAESRVCNLLLQFARHYGSTDKISMNLSQQVISDIIGANRVTTAKIIKKLKEAGVIELTKGDYLIKDMELLKMYAQTDK